MKDSNKATAKGINLQVSTKQCIEICSFVRRKTVNKAKQMLKGVIAKKVAVPMRRFNRDTGHKRGIGPGRYPINAASEVLKLLESVENNALSQGLNPEALKIAVIKANKGEDQWHYGRQRRRKMKRTNIDIVVEETEATKKKAPKAEKPKEAPKVEKPKEAPKAEKPKETPKAEKPKEAPKAEKPAAEKKKENPKKKEKTEESK